MGKNFAGAPGVALGEANRRNTPWRAKRTVLPLATEAMSKLPTGTVTLLFTDIEGSTRLLERLERWLDENGSRVLE